MPSAYAQSTAVREAQQHLSELGYAPGTADGVAGPATVAAIEAFQRDNGLNATGVLDNATLRAIRDSVINQTLFGGAVDLQAQRPDPEIVPLNSDGTRSEVTAGSTSEVNQAEVGPGPTIEVIPLNPTPVVESTPNTATTDITPSIPVPEVRPQTPEQVFDGNSENPTTLSDLLDQIVVPADLPSRLESSTDSGFVSLAPDSEVLSPSKDTTGSQPITLGEFSDPLAQPIEQQDLVGEIDPLLLSQQQGTALAPNVGTTTDLTNHDASNWSEDLSSADSWWVWFADNAFWMSVPILTIMGWLVWLIASRLFGSREPNRVAMTHAEYMGSPAGEGFRRAVGERQPLPEFNIFDDVTQIGRNDRKLDHPLDAAQTGEDRSIAPRPAAFAGNNGEEPSLYDVDSTTTRVQATPVRRNVVDPAIPTDADYRASFRQAEPRQPVVSASTPRIVRTANDHDDLTADNLNVRQTPDHVVEPGDTRDLASRRSRAARNRGRSGLSEGRIVRPTRPRREGI